MRYLEKIIIVIIIIIIIIVVTIVQRKSNATEIELKWKAENSIVFSVPAQS